jgi:hypothetical protein
MLSSYLIPIPTSIQAHVLRTLGTRRAAYHPYPGTLPIPVACLILSPLNINIDIDVNIVTNTNVNQPPPPQLPLD